jgi:FtsP/CotA-like multicopper oxidase with cupredoxin domain
VPDVVPVELDAQEIAWEFVPGRSIPGFAFNGEVPGPTIEANVGDTIEVRLRNSLPQATTIHWHGVRVPAEMDGTEAVQTAGWSGRDLRVPIRGSRRGNVLVPLAHE